MGKKKEGVLSLQFSGGGYQPHNSTISSNEFFSPTGKIDQAQYLTLKKNEKTNKTRALDFGEVNGPSQYGTS